MQDDPSKPPAYSSQLPPPYPGSQEGGHFSGSTSGIPLTSGYPNQSTYTSYPDYRATAAPPPQQYFIHTDELVTQQQPQHVTIIAPAKFGPYPAHVQCSYCSAMVVTATEPINGTMTWCACCLCCVFQCWLGCCLIPFCMNGMRDVKHSCPNCKSYLGLYNRM